MYKTPRQIAEAEAILQKQIEVNRINGTAIEDMYRRQELEIPPAPLQLRTTEEELKDQVKQRDIALGHLKTFMTNRDAANVLYDLLQEPEDLAEFNRFWGLFSRDIAGQTNISPTLFDELWERFKVKLAKTGDTGIFIGPDADEYKAELENLVGEVQGVKEDLVGEVQGVKKEVIRQGNRIDAFNFISKIKSDTIEPIFRTLILNNQEKFPRMESTPADISQGYNRLKIDGKTYIVKINPKSIYISKPKEKPAANLPLKKEILINLLVKRILTKADINPLLLVDEEKQTLEKQTSGKGLPKPSLRDARGIRIIRGLGLIEPSIVVKNRETLTYTEPNFGKYVLSQKALNKGFLHLRYPSGVSIKHFPRTMISSNFEAMLRDLFYHNKFLESDYGELDESEKKLWDEMLIISKLDKKDNKTLYSHRKYNDKDRNESIKRFNILKGELLAGNDNPELIKELKGLIFKLMAKKYIDRKDYHAIMENLMIL